MGFNEVAATNEHQRRRPFANDKEMQKEEKTGAKKRESIRLRNGMLYGCRAFMPGDRRIPISWHFCAFTYFSPFYVTLFLLLLLSFLISTSVVESVFCWRRINNPFPRFK